MKIVMKYPGIIIVMKYPGNNMNIVMKYPGIIMKIVMKYPRHYYENCNEISKALL